MGIYEGIKDVASIVQKADNIDLYSKILDIQKEALDLLDENRKLKTEISKLTEERKISNSLEYVNEVYYLTTDHSIEGPFCSKCWDSDKLLIRTHEFDNNMGEIFNKCPKCGTMASKEKYKPNF